MTLFLDLFSTVTSIESDPYLVFLYALKDLCLEFLLVELKVLIFDFRFELLSLPTICFRLFLMLSELIAMCETTLILVREQTF